MRFVFYVILCFLCINAQAAYNLRINDPLFPAELKEHIIKYSLYQQEKKKDGKIKLIFDNENSNMYLKKLRFVSKSFDAIAAKLFVEKIDVTHSLFMPWYVQMQLHFCDDESLKKLFTSFAHESTIFTMMTHKFFFISQIPKEIILDKTKFKSFSQKFTITPETTTQNKFLFKDEIGSIILHSYIEQYNKKKHSLVAFHFKDYQYTAIKLSPIIYAYLETVIHANEDFSLSFNVDEDNNFAEHQQEKRKTYGILIEDIINKLAFVYDKDKNQVQNKLIKKLKSISIAFPIPKENFNNIKKNLSEKVFIRTHEKQKSNYEENRINSYFEEALNERGLGDICLEYKLTKQLDFIKYFQDSELNLDTYGNYIVRYLQEKIASTRWGDALKILTEKIICKFIEQNGDGRHNQHIIDILKCTKNYLLEDITQKLTKFASQQNNYNIDLIEERYKNITFTVNDYDIKQIYNYILNKDISENIKKEWIKKIPLKISLEHYIEICKEKKYARFLLYKKLSLKARFTFFLGKPLFFWFPESMEEVFLRTLGGSVLWFVFSFLAACICEEIIKKHPNLHFVLRRALLLIHSPWYLLICQDFFWKYWQKDVILEETKIT